MYSKYERQMHKKMAKLNNLIKIYNMYNIGILYYNTYNTHAK